MSEDLSAIGRAELFDADAVGAAGARRFRLFARRGRVTAVMWVEREHAEQLSLAIDRLLSRLSDGKTLRREASAQVTPAPGPPANFPLQADIEFQVAGLQMGYDRVRELILVRASPLVLEEEEEEVIVREDAEPLFSAFISPAQAQRLSEHIVSVLAAGRPRCPYCGHPMESPHLCVKENGYHPANVN
ncbi:MAG: DUF3090 family protein [Ktedonobacterales bacterium]